MLPRQKTMERTGVHLIVADTHFGRADAVSERQKERDLVACLQSFDGEATTLFLLGDVFECFIEYRYLVPRGFVRFQALLADWADAGVEIVYFAGNHDPWHVDYFQTEFGARVVFDELVLEIGGRRTCVRHGDGIARKSRLYNRIRPVLRHPLPVWIYKHLLPGDVGMRLAHLVSSGLGEEAIDLDVARDLRIRAQQLLADGFDQVIMGHSHVAEISQWQQGRYLNPGSWHESRTLLRLDRDEADLLRWNGEVCEAYHGDATPAA